MKVKVAAKKLQDMGENEDTILAHINPDEAAMLKMHGGSGKVNPKTGLLSFGYGSDLGDPGGANEGAGGNYGVDNSGNYAGPEMNWGQRALAAWNDLPAAGRMALGMVPGLGMVAGIGNFLNGLPNTGEYAPNQNEHGGANTDGMYGPFGPFGVGAPQAGMPQAGTPAPTYAPQPFIRKFGQTRGLLFNNPNIVPGLLGGG